MGLLFSVPSDDSISDAFTTNMSVSFENEDGSLIIV